MPTITALKPGKLIPRQDFDEINFRKEIFVHGLHMKWEMAAPCPCSTKLDVTATEQVVYAATQYAEFTREKQTGCTLCSGTGWYYHSTQNIQGIVTGADRTTKVQQYGVYGSGDVVITLLPVHLPSFMDKFTLKDVVVTYSEVLTKSSGTLDKTRYAIVQRTMTVGTSPADPTTSTTTTLGGLSIRSADANGQIEATTYVEGVDFTLTAQGAIDWSVGGNTPTAGTRVSVHYYCNPVFIASSFPHVFRDTRVGVTSTTDIPVALPVNVNARLEFLGDPQ